MTTTEDNIKKMSKMLINAGKTEYTVDKIKSDLDKIMKEDRLMNTIPKALSCFRSKPDVKHALNMGEQQEVQFDVLSVTIRENESFKEPGKKINVQEISLAIDRNHKPEIRICSLWDSSIEVEAGAAYKAKVNIGKGNRINLNPDATYTKLEKLIFTSEDIYIHSDPVENAKEKNAGVWNGYIGEKFKKGEKMWVEVSSDGSFLPTKLWINDPEMYDELNKGDSIVFGGYNGSSGVSPSFIMKVPEKEGDTNMKIGKL